MTQKQFMTNNVFHFPGFLIDFFQAQDHFEGLFLDQLLILDYENKQAPQWNI